MQELIAAEQDRRELRSLRCDSIPVDRTRAAIADALDRDPDPTLADIAGWLEMQQADFERAFLGKGKARPGQAPRDRCERESSDDRAWPGAERARGLLSERTPTSFLPGRASRTPPVAGPAWRGSWVRRHHGLRGAYRGPVLRAIACVAKHSRGEDPCASSPGPRHGRGLPVAKATVAPAGVEMAAEPYHRSGQRGGAAVPLKLT